MKLVAPPLYILAFFVSCDTMWAPHAQDSMRAAEKAGTEDCPVKMKLVAPPLYVLTTQTLEKAKGTDVLNAAVAACKLAIEQAKGRLVIKEAARVVSERDDRLLFDQVKLLSPVCLF
jgi:translation initiation factor 2 subunit 1